MNSGVLGNDVARYNGGAILISSPFLDNASFGFSPGNPVRGGEQGGGCEKGHGVWVRLQTGGAVRQRQREERRDYQKVCC